MMPKKRQVESDGTAELSSKKLGESKPINQDRKDQLRRNSQTYRKKQAARQESIEELCRHMLAGVSKAIKDLGDERNNQATRNVMVLDNLKRHLSKWQSLAAVNGITFNS